MPSELELLWFELHNLFFLQDVILFFLMQEFFPSHTEPDFDPQGVVQTIYYAVIYKLGRAVSQVLGDRRLLKVTRECISLFTSGTNSHPVFKSIGLTNEEVEILRTDGYKAVIEECEKAEARFKEAETNGEVTEERKQMEKDLYKMLNKFVYLQLKKRSSPKLPLVLDFLTECRPSSDIVVTNDMIVIMRTIGRLFSGAINGDIPSSNGVAAASSPLVLAWICALQSVLVELQKMKAAGTEYKYSTSFPATTIGHYDVVPPIWMTDEDFLDSMPPGTERLMNIAKNAALFGMKEFAKMPMSPFKFMWSQYISRDIGLQHLRLGGLHRPAPRDETAASHEPANSKTSRKKAAKESDRSFEEPSKKKKLLGRLTNVKNRQSSMEPDRLKSPSLDFLPPAVLAIMSIATTPELITIQDMMLFFCIKDFFLGFGEDSFNLEGVVLTIFRDLCLNLTKTIPRLLGPDGLGTVRREIFLCLKEERNSHHALHLSVCSKHVLTVRRSGYEALVQSYERAISGITAIATEALPKELNYFMYCYLKKGSDPKIPVVVDYLNGCGIQAQMILTNVIIVMIRTVSKVFMRPQYAHLLSRDGSATPLLCEVWNFVHIAVTKELKEMECRKIGYKVDMDFPDTFVGAYNYLEDIKMSNEVVIDKAAVKGIAGYTSRQVPNGPTTGTVAQGRHRPMNANVPDEITKKQHLRQCAPPPSARCALSTSHGEPDARRKQIVVSGHPYPTQDMPTLSSIFSPKSADVTTTRKRDSVPDATTCPPQKNARLSPENERPTATDSNLPQLAYFATPLFQSLPTFRVGTSHNQACPRPTTLSLRISGPHAGSFPSTSAGQDRLDGLDANQRE